MNILFALIEKFHLLTGRCKTYPSNYNPCSDIFFYILRAFLFKYLLLESKLKL